jgi:catechol 2,3-dioxygenase-like lactoylglutathione lyase family enzyme
VIKSIKFVSIYVTDQDRALDFYTTKLGFSIITDQPFGPDARWIELRIPGAETGLVIFKPMSPDMTIGGFRSISFEVDDTQKTYEELKAKGVEFVQAPKKESWGTSALFKDPDGNTFVMSGR